MKFAPPIVTAVLLGVPLLFETVDPLNSVAANAFVESLTVEYETRDTLTEKFYELPPYTTENCLDEFEPPLLASA